MIRKLFMFCTWRWLRRLAICCRIELSRDGRRLIRSILARVVGVLLTVATDANDPDLVSGDGHAFHGLETILTNKFKLKYLKILEQFDNMCKLFLLFKSASGSSISDARALRGQGFCNNSIEALVLKKAS